MKRKEVDIAFYTSKSYVQAKKQLPNIKYMATHKTTAKNGKIYDYYLGVIIARKDSNIKTLEDLKGKTFGFTNVNSGSGFAYPSSMLRRKGIDYKTYFSKVLWLEKHHRITGAVAKKSIDAGATWDQNFDAAKIEYGDIFRLIAETAPIPNDPIVASASFDENSRKKLVNILTSITANSKVMKAMQKNGFPDVGFSKRDDAFYDVVRNLKK